MLARYLLCALMSKSTNWGQAVFVQDLRRRFLADVFCGCFSTRVKGSNCICGVPRLSGRTSSSYTSCNFARKLNTPSLRHLLAWPALISCRSHSSTSLRSSSVTFLTIGSTQSFILWQLMLCVQAQCQTTRTIVNDRGDLPLIFQFLISGDSFPCNRGIHCLGIGPLSCLCKIIAYPTQPA